MPKTATIEDIQDTPDEFTAQPGGLPSAPEGSAERVLDDVDANIPEAGADERVMVQTYDANGEATEVEAERPREPEPDLFPTLYPAEMHDGKEVQQHQVRFGGKATIGRAYANDRAFWDSLLYGRRVNVLVSATISGDGHSPIIDRGGDVLGVVGFRKLKIDALQIEGGTVFEDIDDDREDLIAEREEAREELMDFRRDVIGFLDQFRTDESVSDDDLVERLYLLCGKTKTGEPIDGDAAMQADLAENVDMAEPEPTALDEALAEALG